LKIVTDEVIKKLFYHNFDLIENRPLNGNWKKLNELRADLELLPSIELHTENLICLSMTSFQKTLHRQTSLSRRIAILMQILQLALLISYSLIIRFIFIVFI